MGANIWEEEQEKRSFTGGSAVWDGFVCKGGPAKGQYGVLYAHTRFL
jgi:hypothetical protein